jgi:hypothetical protein
MPLSARRFKDWILENDGLALQPRTSERLIALHGAVETVISGALGEARKANLKDIIREAGGHITYDHLSRPNWPFAVRRALLHAMAKATSGPLRVALHHQRVLGRQSILRLTLFGPQPLLLDCRCADADNQPRVVAEMIAPLQSPWLADRPITLIDATNGFPLPMHPLRAAGDRFEVAARVNLEDISPRPRTARIGAQMRMTVAEVVCASRDGIVEVRDPDSPFLEYVTFAGGGGKYPCICRPLTVPAPGRPAGAARRARALELAEYVLQCASGRFAGDSSIFDAFELREQQTALAHVALLREAMRLAGSGSPDGWSTHG